MVGQEYVPESEILGHFWYVLELRLRDSMKTMLHTTRMYTFVIK